MPGARGTPSERFWPKVEKTPDCWLWRGYTMPNGYGTIRTSNGKKMLSHRFSFEEVIGKIPNGLDINHICRVRNCVRPDHLRPATRKENLNAPGSMVGKVHAPRKICKHGHEFNESNTYIWRGERSCRTCRSRRMKEFNARKNGAQ